MAGNRSWLPPEEVRDQREPELLALLGVELRARQVVLGDKGGDRHRIGAATRSAFTSGTR